MRAYSIDLRERVIRAVEAGPVSQAEVAEQFEVSLSFVEKLLRRWRTTHDLTPRVGTPGPKRVLAPWGARIRAAVRQQPDLTLDELCTRLKQERGVVAYPSMMWRELERLGLVLKKSRSTTASGIPCG